MAASLSFLGGGWGRRPIWLGKMVSSVLCSRVKRRIILVECNLIVNFYHVLEAVIRLHFRTILISLSAVYITHNVDVLQKMTQGIRVEGDFNFTCFSWGNRTFFPFGPGTSA